MLNNIISIRRHVSDNTLSKLHDRNVVGSCHACCHLMRNCARRVHKIAKMAGKESKEQLNYMANSSTPANEHSLEGTAEERVPLANTEETENIVAELCRFRKCQSD